MCATYRLRVICALSLSYYKWGIEGASLVAYACMLRLGPP